MMQGHCYWYYKMPLNDNYVLEVQYSIRSKCYLEKNVIYAIVTKFSSYQLTRVKKRPINKTRAGRYATFLALNIKLNDLKALCIIIIYNLEKTIQYFSIKKEN